MHTFYCTNKGQHKRREIGVIQDGQENNESQQQAEQIFAEFGFPDEKYARMPSRLIERRSRKRTNFETGKVIKSAFDGVTSKDTKNGRQWTFTCPTCDRSPRVTDKQLKQLFDMAAQRPTIALDISKWAQ